MSGSAGWLVVAVGGWLSWRRGSGLVVPFVGRLVVMGEWERWLAVVRTCVGVRLGGKLSWRECWQGWWLGDLEIGWMVE